ncbi:hypothetical protein G6514_007452 [Epicoccum nigrum]|nr:hypothetical protein G6514_007452 [Epicoccum nigrum]
MDSDTPKLDRRQHASEELGGLQESLDRVTEKTQDSPSAQLGIKDLRIQILEHEASILRQKLNHEKSRVQSFEDDFKLFREIIAALYKLMRAAADHLGQKLEEEDAEEQTAQEVAAASAQVSPQDTDAESTVTGTSQIVSVAKKKMRSGAAQRKARRAKKAAAAE